MSPRTTTAPAGAAEPAGFLYVPELITAVEERALLAWFAASPEWKLVTFRGQTARRRAMSFGARYLTQGRQLEPAPELAARAGGVSAIEWSRRRARGSAGSWRWRGVRSPTSVVHGAALSTGRRDRMARGQPRLRTDGPVAVAGRAGAAAIAAAERATTPARAACSSKSSRRAACSCSRANRASDWQHRVCPVRAERYSLTVRSAADPEIA